MPFGNANEQTEELLQKQILPRIKGFPIVAGVMANDPGQPMAVLLERLRGLRHSGHHQLAGGGLIDGRPGGFDQDGFTVEREIEMLVEARRNGFVTLGFDHRRDALRMSEAGVEALIFTAGWTHETQDIYEKNDRIEYLIVKVKRYSMRCDARADPLFLFLGRRNHPRGQRGIIPPD
jgi:predicted TIM-barrel enzyme